MKSDWIFLNQDNTKDLDTLDIQQLPNLDEGKIYNDRNYQVVFIGKNLVSRPNPLILAVELKN